jgi:hypothetical protein
MAINDPVPVPTLDTYEIELLLRGLALYRDSVCFTASGTRYDRSTCGDIKSLIKKLWCLRSSLGTG